MEEEEEQGEEKEGRGRRRRNRAECVGLHVSWPSAAGVSLALDRSESASRLEMRSSSAWTSPRPSLEPATGRRRQRNECVHRAGDEQTNKHRSQWDK